MKKLLFFCFGLLSYLAISAQEPTQTIGGTATQANKVKGRLYIDSVLYIPVRDTTFTPLRIGALTIRPQDSAIYVATSIVAPNKWKKWAKYSDIVGGSATWGGIGGTLADQTDLAAALAAKVPTTRTLTIDGTTYDLSANRTWTTSGGAVTPITSYALRFDHYDGSGNVAVLKAYPTYMLFKKCMYEWWLMPDDSAEYAFSWGYGGSHGMLFGFNGSTTGKMLLAGNMWHNGVNVLGLNGQDTIVARRLIHLAVVYDGVWVTTFVNGVPSKRVAYTGYRSTNSSPADIGAFLGGSDHSKFRGWILKFRAYETFDNDPPVGTTTCFQPKKYWDNSDGAYVQWDLTTPANTITNHGLGLFGNEFTGKLNSGAPFSNYSQSGGSNSDTALQPHWVPFDFVQTPYTETLPTIPAAAEIFDDFRRQDNTLAFTNNPSLDSTRGGTAGKLKWNLNTAQIAGGSNFAGVNCNKAYFNDPTNWAYVTAGSSDDSIIVTKSTLAENGIKIFARRSDATNYVYLTVDQTSGYAYLYKTVSGSDTYLADYAFNTSYTKITMVVSGNTCRVYENGTLKITASITGTSGNGVGIGAVNAFAHIDSYEVHY